MAQTQNDTEAVKITTNHYYLVPKFESLADVDEFFKALTENQIPPVGEYTLTEYADNDKTPAERA
jgi:hypothetical protein